MPQHSSRTSGETCSAQELRRARHTHRRAQALTRSCLDDVRCGRGIDAAAVKTVVTDCVRSLQRNPDLLLWLGKTQPDGEDTATHSLNTGLLAIAFGRYLGAAEDDLNRLGVAGLLHDVGKMHTPPALLNKAGPLDAGEFSIVQRHTQHGHDILRDHGRPFHGAMEVAYSHHENLDGSGYPRRIRSTDISRFTRIVMLCDVYDAVTSDRVYRRAAPSSQALRIIAQQTGSRFDPKLARQFIDFIGPYPPGSIVELASGEAAVVIGSNSRHPRLPRIIVVRNGDDSPTDHILDLEHCARQQHSPRLIQRLLPNGSRNIHIEDYLDKLDRRR